MPHPAHRLEMIQGPSGLEPAVNQGVECGWYMSWNPDDNRFYVSPHADSTEARVFKDWRNAVQYARRNPHPLA